MDTTAFKQRLRKHFEQFFTSEDLNQWFDPLTLKVDPEEKIISVSFPHDLFGHWFKENRQKDFERHCKTIHPFSIHCHSVPEERQKSSLPGPAREAQKQLEKQSNATIIGRIPLLDHTFSSFLVNKKNDFPLAAAKEAVFKLSPPPYTPLAIFGQSGTGKTHLLEAMINALQEYGAPLLIFYGDVREFIVYAQANPNQNLLEIQAFFIDEAQNLLDCSAGNQKFFSSQLDLLHRSDKLMVFSFDVTPTQCSGLLPQLRQRLTSGLLVQLKKPDVHIRRQYVQQMNDEFHLGLTKEDTLLMAQHFTDFRTIIGALTRIKAYKLLVQNELPDLRDILDTITEQNTLTSEDIIAKAASFYKVPAEDVPGKKRSATICLARQAAMYLCRELLGLSLVQVGGIFGGRDHSSVIYSLKKIKQMRESNKDIDNALSQLKRMCVNKDQLV